MFDNINKQNQVNKSAGASVPPARGGTEDIFAATDSLAESLNQGKETPATFRPKPLSAPLGGVAPGIKERLAASGRGNRKYFILGLVILVLALFAAGGFWGVSKYGPMLKGSKNASQTVENIPEDQGAAEIVTQNQSVGGEIADNQEQVASSQPIDSDQDGLTDEEEKSLGTSKESVDSDNDGLFDREEVKVYKTNPLKTDTDGDGYSDGDEVRGSYNPNGSGKLYEIN